MWGSAQVDDLIFFFKNYVFIKVLFRDILHGIAVAEEFDFGPEPTIEVLAFLQ